MGGGGPGSGRRARPAQQVDGERRQRQQRAAVAVGGDVDALAAGLAAGYKWWQYGNEALIAEIADSPTLATLVGEHSRYLWPDSYDLRRIPVRDPAPVYPMSLIWRDDNPHPALGTLRAHLRSRRGTTSGGRMWMPAWTGSIRQARERKGYTP